MPSTALMLTDDDNDDDDDRDNDGDGGGGGEQELVETIPSHLSECFWSLSHLTEAWQMECTSHEAFSLKVSWGSDAT